MNEKRKYEKCTNESNMNLDKKEIREYFYHTARKLFPKWRVHEEYKDKKIRRFEEALKYYADINSYCMTAEGSIFMRTDQPWLRAHKALEKDNE